MITTDIEKVVDALNKSEAVAIPTETVYGLAANAFDESAIKKVYEIKGRPFYNPLIVHIKSLEYLDVVAKDIPDIAIVLAEKFWPGPLTLLLNKTDLIPDIVTAGNSMVAVRIPNHKIALELLREIDFPLAAPSANPFGSISPTNANHVQNYFKNNLLVLEGGECQRGVESTIIGFKNNQAVLYRHGSIPLEEIVKITGNLIFAINADKSPTAPGTLSKHYAPKTEIYLTNKVAELIKIFPNKKIGLLLFKQRISDPRISFNVILSETGSLDESARNLYAALHDLDTRGLDIIIAEKFPDEGLGKTINDRLNRATQK
jgi:L-threonylcarbamoyladenylate synthase